MKFFISLTKIAIGIYLIFLFLEITTNLFSSYKNKYRTNSDFVSAVGTRLSINNKDFKSIGVNRYNLLSYKGNHCANSFTEEEISDMFQKLHEIGITSIRFWMFQSFTKSGEDLSRFDYVLKQAKKNGIYLIPVFENQWADCTGTEMKSDEWYKSGYLYPYENYAISYKEYVGKIVFRYKNDPAILTWELMNEARASKDNLYFFAKDMTNYVRSLDEFHLISLGTSGTELAQEDYVSIYELPNVDMLEYHDYEDIYNNIPETLKERIDDSEYLQKPIVVGESGIQLSVSDQPYLLQQKIESFFQNGGSVYLIWSYGGDAVTDDGYNFDINDDIAEVIRKISINIAP